MCGVPGTGMGLHSSLIPMFGYNLICMKLYGLSCHGNSGRKQNTSQLSEGCLYCWQLPKCCCIRSLRSIACFLFCYKLAFVTLHTREAA